jgi:hypothetical protein
LLIIAGIVCLGMAESRAEAAAVTPHASAADA